MRYAYVIPASYDYIPGLAALLASIDKYTPDVDIILVSYEIPKEFLVACDTLTLNIIDVPQKEKEPDQKLATIIERFRVTSEVMKNYDSICFIDADMFLLGDVSLFFDIAAKGFIVTAHNGGIIGFTKEHQRLGKADLGVDNYIYTKTHTAVPVFASAIDADWFQAVYSDYDRKALDDYTLLNLKGIQLEKFKRMISLPAYAFTGIHHWQMKPETGLITMGNLVLTGTEEQPYMTHGKWWDKGWIDSLMLVSEKYLIDFGYKPEQVRHKVWRSFDILLNEYKGLIGTFNSKTGIDIFVDFEKYCTMNTIDLTNYRELMKSKVVQEMKINVTSDADPKHFISTKGVTLVDCDVPNGNNVIIPEAGIKDMLLQRNPKSLTIPFETKIKFPQEPIQQESKLIEQYFDQYPLLKGFAVSWDWTEDVNHCNPFDPLLFYMICKGANAKNILEIGCERGYSSYILATAAKENAGTYIGIEISRTFADQLSKGLKEGNFPHIMIWGSSLDMKSLDFVSSLDFVLIDGNHSVEGIWNDFHLILPKLHPNSYVVIHDAYRWGAEGIMKILDVFGDQFEFITTFWNFGSLILRPKAIDWTDQWKERVEEAKKLNVDMTWSPPDIPPKGEIVILSSMVQST